MSVFHSDALKKFSEAAKPLLIRRAAIVYHQKRLSEMNAKDDYFVVNGSGDVKNPGVDSKSISSGTSGPAALSQDFGIRKIFGNSQILTSHILPDYSKQIEDLKNADQTLLKGHFDLVAQQLGALKAGVQSTFGNRPMKIRMPYSFTQSCANVTGILQAFTPLDATACAEYASLAALFDEYKVNSFHVAFNVTAVGGTSNQDGMFVLAYEPLDGSFLTSVRNGTEIARHLLCGTMQYSGGLQIVFARAAGKPYEFGAEIPKGVALGFNSGVPYDINGAWVPTISTATNCYWGYLKTYCQTGYVTVTNSVNGIIYLDAEYRCRT